MATQEVLLIFEAALLEIQAEREKFRMASQAFTP
jgi:hypothetical protein